MILLPKYAIAAGGRAAWMVAVIAGLVGLATVILVGKLSQRFPDQSIDQYAQQIIGPWPGKLLGLLLYGLIALNTAVDLRIAILVLLGVFFHATPAWAIGLMLIVTSLSMVWWGMGRSARLGPILLIALATTTFFTFPPLFRWMRPGYVLPLFDLTALNWPSVPFWVALGSFRSYILLLALIPRATVPARAVRLFGWAFAAAWFSVLFAVLAPVMVFGPTGAMQLARPFPYVIAIIRFTHFPIEHFEMIGRTVTTLNILFSIALMYFVGGVLGAGAFGRRPNRPFMLATALLSLLPIILIPGEKPGEMFSNWVIIGTMATIWIVFPLLWLIYWLRGLHRQPPM